MLYFAYGSNLSTTRLADRIPSPPAVTIAQLREHRLSFRKNGKDGSGKCDIESTSNPKDVVHGVVFRITASDKLELDSIEGLGYGYEEKQVSAVTTDGDTLEAVTYYATHIDTSLE
ncbi:MAG: gamma-glutamylcyclotransferase family protein, partial [Gammaproteobacteria bacterium]